MRIGDGPAVNGAATNDPVAMAKQLELGRTQARMNRAVNLLAVHACGFRDFQCQAEIARAVAKQGPKLTLADAQGNQMGPPPDVAAQQAARGMAMQAIYHRDQLAQACREYLDLMAAPAPKIAD